MGELRLIAALEARRLGFRWRACVHKALYRSWQDSIALCL